MDIDSLWLVMGRMGAVARQPNIELLLLMRCQEWLLDLFVYR